MDVFFSAYIYYGLNNLFLFITGNLNIHGGLYANVFWNYLSDIF